MNWIYVDKDTYEIKFGTRQFSEGQLTGPWDCTRQDRRMMFSGWEGFVAVQEGDFWALYFDRDGDRLKSKVPPGTPVLEIELVRKEMRGKKPPPPPPPAPEPPKTEGGEQNGGQKGEKNEETTGEQTSKAEKPEEKNKTSGGQKRRRSPRRPKKVTVEDLPEAPGVD
jgi:hypothetical protein